MDIGDTVNVHFRIIEGEKEACRFFRVLIVALKRGVNEMAIVHASSTNMGVGCIFPVHLPKVVVRGRASRRFASRQALLPPRAATAKSRACVIAASWHEGRDGCPDSGGSIGMAPVAPPPTRRAKKKGK